MELLLIEKIAYLHYERDMNIEEIQEILLLNYDVDLSSSEIIRLLKEA